MNVNTGNKILVTAEELEEGDIIPGKLSGDDYKITHIAKGPDDILGSAVFVTVQAEDEPLEYAFRPFDKLWILA